ncbi:MSMEG_0568 family radical SAM protein [Aquimarina sp. RZ0]|uniref:MSMEG_0568 family radical SAM protein n=1 Tax=Aquimarina sp. RZ0 TaxID=2607730 RepID=UPI0011F145F4|nr:MSMEG_0568 family radical SAM protein [Aquimarina sp. RZ0]KAA1243132.1 MSMEG_0568 family radical SAM protein [Aquimarina sp. RZ0]
MSSTITQTNNHILLNEIQTQGIRLEGISDLTTREGGAGPTDHKAVTIFDSTIMIPVFSQSAKKSPFTVSSPSRMGYASLKKNEKIITTIRFIGEPKFYKENSSDGIPFWKIARLHSKDVLATTVLQNCIRYKNQETSCQFCAIGESLKHNTTIAYKKPHHLAEVAQRAVELDGISQFIMTTGTPGSSDRGAKILLESVTAVRDVVDIPIQIQCEPPDTFEWFTLLKDAGASSIGMHLEAVSDSIRKKVMPGKAEVSLLYYFEAFKAAVSIFGKGNVSTYILAGLGDTQEEILKMSQKLIHMGVYPFVVPFVPIRNTPLENHSSPDKEFMHGILAPLSQALIAAEMTSDTISSGCAKCGACSTLSTFEKNHSS